MLRFEELFGMNEPFVPCYDGDDDDKGTDDKGTDDKGTDDDKKDKTFTQAEVDHIVQKEKAEQKRSTQKRIGELEKFRDGAKLSQSEKEALEVQIGDMQKQIETKEDQARRERETTAKKHTREMSEVAENRDTWRTRYTDSIASSALIDAAVQNNAFNTEQIVAVLRPKTVVVEVMDEDGKSTGKYKEQITFDGFDAKGKPEQIITDAATVVKRMLDDDRYMNLFKNDKTPGLGVRTTTTQKKSGTPKDTGEYIKQRREERKNRRR